jgi:hypothetical protein
VSDLETAIKNLQEAMIDDLAKDRAEIMRLEKFPWVIVVALGTFFTGLIIGVFL